MGQIEGEKVNNKSLVVFQVRDYYGLVVPEVEINLFQCQYVEIHMKYLDN